MTPEIKTYVLSQRATIFSFLEEMVRIQSGSHNKAGVDAVGQLIRRTCRTLPVRIQTVEQTDLGNHLIVSSRTGDVEKGRILLVGHMALGSVMGPMLDWILPQALSVRGVNHLVPGQLLQQMGW